MKQTNNYVTREEIFAVCNDYWARYSRVPTQKEIRVALGDRGSIGTINKYVNEWKKLDENVEQIISTYGLKLTNSALEIAKKLYATGFYDGDTSANSEQVDLLNKENEELREEIMGYKETCQELTGKQQAYDSNQIQLLNKVEQQAKEKANLEAKVEKMERDINNLLQQISQKK